METHRERPPGAPDDTLDDDDALVGRRLGEFVVRARLGAGGHGAVYLAEQPLLERQAVIKVLHAELRSDQNLVQRFSREARLASRIDHPYAAHIYAFGAEPEGLMWIAMEYVQGTSLDTWLETHGPMPPERFAPLLERLCEVVHHAHGRGVVHRDLKPGNIMLLARAGRLLPKLLDLGIARVVEQIVPSATATASTPAMPRLDTSRLPRAGLDTLAAEPDPTGDDRDAALLATLASEPEPTDAPDGDHDVTRSGAILGSPPYMAPEQWLDASSVDARTDIYALGVLTYEILTGTRPFVAATWPALLSAHVDRPPPPLGHGLPDAIDAVVQRALAKKPDDRWPSALEMSAAFADAVRGAPSAPPRPRLEPALHDLIVAEAPAPIAESVAALAACTHVWQACAALQGTRDALVHAVAMVVLAAHAARKPPTAPDAPRLATLTTRLAASRPDHRTWLELACTLAAPWAAHPELHPVPELVEILVERTGEPGPLTRTLHTLADDDTLARALRDPDTDRDTLEQALAGALEHLADALRAAEPWFAWRWAAPSASRFALGTSPCLGEDACGSTATQPPPQTGGDVAKGDRGGGGAQLWMGTATPRRRVAVPGAAHGRVVLLDTLDRVALELWPLVDVARPTPGAPEAMFLFDGRRGEGTGEWVRSAPPRGFEQAAPLALDAWLHDVLPMARTAVTEAATVVGDTAPWPGLATYARDDAARFFGRESETATARNQLRIDPLLAVVGPSGSGKSSFVLAGLLPALDEAPRVVALRPGADPLGALGAHLAAVLGDDALPTPDALRAEPALLGPWLRGRARRGAIVVFVDQLEELFTLGADEPDMHAFAAALVGAARTVADPVRVIVTLRDDFLGRAQALRGLSERLARGMLLLGTPDREALRRILVEPARRAGVAFEDDALVDDMIAAVAGRPGALPLLTFAASRLWAARTDDAVLTRAAYLSMGGVGGALAGHAEETLSTLSAEQRALVRRAFARLVTSEGTRAVPTRQSLEQVLGGDAAAHRVIEALVGARLLVVYDDVEAHDAERVEVAHEALLSAWPRLVRWRREDAEQTRLREQLGQAARQWDDRERQRGLLWRDAALTELELWLDRDDGALADTLDAREQAFVAASRAETRRARSLKRALVALVVIGLLAGLALQWRATLRTEEARARADVERKRAERSAASAREARDLAEQRAAEVAAAMASLNEDQGRRALLDGDPARALELLDAAVQSDGQTPVRRAMLTTLASAALDAELARLEGHRFAVTDVIVTPDGAAALSVSWDRTGRLWALDAGQTTATLQAGGRLEGIATSAAGDRAVVFGEEAEPRVFNLSNGVEVSTLRGHASGPILSAAFAPDGQRVVTGGRDGRAIVHRMITGEPLHVLEGHTDAVEAIAWSADGRWIATGGDDGRVLVFDTDTPEAAPLTAHVLEPLGGAITALALTPDGSRLIATTASGLVGIWVPASADGATQPWTLGAVLEGHLAAVDGLVVRDDGRRLLTWSSDGTARVWSLGLRPRELLRLADHDGPVTDAVFVAGGARVATAGHDGRVRTFDADTGALLAVRRGHTGRVSALAARGDEVVSGGQDATVRRWRTAPDGLTAILAVPGADADTGGTPALALSGALGDDEIVVASGRQAARWSAASPEAPVAVLEGGLPQTIAALATVGTDVWLGARDGTMKRWSASGDGVELVDETAAGRGHWRGVLGFAVRPGDTGQVVSHGADGRVKLWSSDSTAPTSGVEAHGDVVSAVAWTPDGAALITASGARESRAAIWRLDEAGRFERVHLLEGHRAALTSVDVDASGTRVATASADKVVLVWDVASGERVAELRGHESSVERVRFDPSGTRLATASADGTVRVWRVEDGAQLQVLGGQGDAMLDVVWHPGAAVLASASSDGAVRLWGADDGQLLAVLPGHGRRVGELAFGGAAADTLRVSAADGTVWVWSL